MDTKTGWIITGITAALCGCPGACMVLSGALSAMGLGTYNYELLGESTSGQTPVWIGVTTLCAGLIFFVIPLAVGGYTYFKGRKTSITDQINLNEELPPTS